MQPSDTWANIGSENPLQHLASMYMFACYAQDSRAPFYVPPSYARWAKDVALNGPTEENNGLGNEVQMTETLETMLGRACCGENSALNHWHSKIDPDAFKAVLVWWLKFSREILEGKR